MFEVIIHSSSLHLRGWDLEKLNELPGCAWYIVLGVGELEKEEKTWPYAQEVYNLKERDKTPYKYLLEAIEGIENPKSSSYTSLQLFLIALKFTTNKKEKNDSMKLEYWTISMLCSFSIFGLWSSISFLPVLYVGNFHYQITKTGNERCIVE